MKELYYIRLDVHKKSISYCIKTQAGRVVAQGKVTATRAALREWAATIDHPWVGALEATIFTSWIYDYLAPFAEELHVAHPAMLKAIACAKKKNDRLDASKICDLLRCDLLPQCYLAPREIRELRRVLRYRNLLVSEAVRMKNKIAGLLMEVGEHSLTPRLDSRTLGGTKRKSMSPTPVPTGGVGCLHPSLTDTYHGCRYLWGPRAASCSSSSALRTASRTPLRKGTHSGPEKRWPISSASLMITGEREGSSIIS